MITEHKPLPSCSIGPEVHLDPSVRVGEGSIIRGEVELRAGAQVGRFCMLEGAPGRKSVIDSGAVLEDFVKVYPGVSIGAGSRVEAFTILGHPTKADLVGRDEAGHLARVRDLLIERPETLIGPGAVIRSHSVIYSHVRIGASFITGHNIMIREHTRVGDGVVFGTHASTDGYCCIGPLCHIGQYSQLSQAARIGRGVFIGGHTVFSDNKQAVRDVEEDLFGATVEDHVRIGLGCVILPAVRICTGALIGAGSVVTRDVPEKTLAYGNPARVIRELTPEEVQRYLSSVEKGIVNGGFETHPDKEEL